MKWSFWYKSLLKPRTDILSKQRKLGPRLFKSVDKGGFQLLDLILPELKSHVIPYKFKSSHWMRANLVKDFFLQMNFPPMRTLEFIRDHMTFKLRYNQI